jgi:hypothetical protein
VAERPLLYRCFLGVCVHARTKRCVRNNTSLTVTIPHYCIHPFKKLELAGNSLCFAYRKLGYIRDLGGASLIHGTYTYGECAALKQFKIPFKAQYSEYSVPSSFFVMHSLATNCSSVQPVKAHTMEVPLVITIHWSALYAMSFLTKRARS